MPFFDVGRTGLLDGTIDWTSDDVRMMVMNNTYSFSAASANIAAIVADEQTTFTRQSLAGRTLVNNTAVTPNRTEYQGPATVTFPSVAAGTAPSGCVLFKFVTNDSDSLPLWFGQFSSPDSPNGNNFDVNEPAEGWAFADAVGTT